MTQRLTGQRFRQRKLSTKQNLPVLREHEVDVNLDDEAQRNIPRIETGVEKGEEIEHHLQAVISAAQTGGKVAQIYIPTPETQSSQLQYERLYSQRWEKPATNIRFSSTVEDCIGCPYNMNANDEIFLKKLNAKKGADKQCSEDVFEEVMNFFEETSQSKQPFAAVDNPPVVSLDEMKAAFDETIGEQHVKFADAIYDHWKNQRMLHGNRALMPTLKFETNAETDDSDPYVCFRRREIRQTRKTRGRDAQVAEKLRKLRRELEDARQLVHLVKQREFLLREKVATDRHIFEQRGEVKSMKRKLGIKDTAGDEDLINQKPPPKKPKVELNNMRAVPGAVPRPILTQPNGRPIESDQVTLEDWIAQNNLRKARFIDENKKKHKTWNQGYIDDTTRAIDPLDTPMWTSDWAQAQINYELPPSPPPSIPDEQSFRTVDPGLDSGVIIQDSAVSSYPSPPKEVDGLPEKGAPSRPSEVDLLMRDAPWSPPDDGPPAHSTRQHVRQRRGRGGRVFIDRRPIPSVDDADSPTFGFLDSMYDPQVYVVDQYSNDAIAYRTYQTSPPGPRRSVGGVPPLQLSQPQGPHAGRPVAQVASG